MNQPFSYHVHTLLEQIESLVQDGDLPMSERKRLIRVYWREIEADIGHTLWVVSTPEGRFITRPTFTEDT